MVLVAVSSSANANAFMPTLRGHGQTRAAGIPAGGFFLVSRITLSRLLLSKLGYY